LRNLLVDAWRGRCVAMLDVVFVLMTVVFFVVSLGYVAGCDRLK
jgi:hypothetical protein